MSEPGVYWKVQHSASGSFLLSFTTLHAGLGDISQYGTAGGWRPPAVNYGAVWDEEQRFLEMSWSRCPFVAGEAQQGGAQSVGMGQAVRFLVASSQREGLTVNMGGLSLGQGRCSVLSVLGSVTWWPEPCRGKKLEKNTGE